MDAKIKKLAEKAGFCFWEDEAWRPKDAIIDWGSNYDEELVKFYELVTMAAKKTTSVGINPDTEIVKYLGKLSPRFRVGDCLPVNAGVYFWILKNGPRGFGQLNGKYVTFEKDHRGVSAGSKWAICENDEWQGIVNPL